MADMKKRDDCICDSFSDIIDSSVSFVCHVLKLDYEDFDEEKFNCIAKKLYEIIEINLSDRVEIFKQTILNCTSYNVITEKHIKELLQKLKIKSSIFDKFVIQIGPFIEDIEGSGEYYGSIFCDFGKELRSYYEVLPNFIELDEISPLCVDELKNDVQEIEYIEENIYC
ncbi:MAG: hypothetical protein EOM55_00320 [Clostridia bacterium]|nr:hypothetical protein [Clostridia bacterium]